MESSPCGISACHTTHWKDGSSVGGGWGAAILRCHRSRKSGVSVGQLGAVLSLKINKSLAVLFLPRSTSWKSFRNTLLKAQEPHFPLYTWPAYQTRHYKNGLHVSKPQSSNHGDWRISDFRKLKLSRAPFNRGRVCKRGFALQVRNKYWIDSRDQANKRRSEKSIPGLALTCLGSLEVFHLQLHSTDWQRGREPYYSVEIECHLFSRSGTCLDVALNTSGRWRSGKIQSVGAHHYSHYNQASKETVGLIHCCLGWGLEIQLSWLFKCKPAQFTFFKMMCKQPDPFALLQIWKCSSSAK